MSPATGSLMFSGFLVCVVLSMLARERARHRDERPQTASQG